MTAYIDVLSKRDRLSYEIKYCRSCTNFERIPLSALDQALRIEIVSELDGPNNKRVDDHCFNNPQTKCFVRE